MHLLNFCPFLLCHFPAGGFRFFPNSWFIFWPKRLASLLATPSWFLILHSLYSFWKTEFKKFWSSLSFHFFFGLISKKSLPKPCVQWYFLFILEFLDLDLMNHGELICIEGRITSLCTTRPLTNPQEPCSVLTKLLLTHTTCWLVLCESTPTTAPLCSLCRGHWLGPSFLHPQSQVHALLLWLW